MPYIMQGNVPRPNRTRGLFNLAGYGISCALLLGHGADLFAQDLMAEPLFGSTTLDGGFMPDPMVVPLIAGGSDSVEDLATGCVGYITDSQPDYQLFYTPSGYPLGFFVQSDVDTTLVVNGPDAGWHCNDDSAALTGFNPGISFASPLAGRYDIWIGTYATDDFASEANLVITEMGESSWLSMDINVDEESDAQFWDTLASLDDGGPGTALSTGEMHGNLATGDGALPGYGYADTFSFESDGSAQRIITDLQSSDFDTYLLVQSPSGKDYRSDDYAGSMSRSLLSLNMDEAGIWKIVVSSFMSGETGDYVISLAAEAEPSAVAGSRNESGSLDDSDTVMASGEYIDIYDVEGRPGQRLELDLRSDDFDTYLILLSPSGQQAENDDADSTSRSYLNSILTEVGTYQVIVTSYAAGSSGDYRLTLLQNEADVDSDNERDVAQLTLGEAMTGALGVDDLSSSSGVFEDTFAFQGNAGQTLRIRMASEEFDTYVRLLTPSGETIENDDFEGDIFVSAIDLTLPESGRYRVIATSYSSGMTGPYTVDVSPLETNLIADNRQVGGRIFGIFAGIADYPGYDADLDFTDQDAIRARDALITNSGLNPDDAITLLNADATVANLRDAITRISREISEDDTFVLFYSGHGSRIERASGPDSADPDGIDETIELYDGAVLDDELAEMLDQISAGTTLLVLDSCFSGGFSKDIISRPGRMGLFSSEEDVTSQVAAKFRAGGYLSVFFEEALGGYADEDGDGELTALELSEYLHLRFRSDVKSAGVDQYVRTGGPQAGYQHLVVDRGGVGPYNVLFNHR